MAGDAFSEIVLFPASTNGPQLYMGDGTVDPASLNNPVIWFVPGSGGGTIFAAATTDGLTLDDNGGGLTISAATIGFFGAPPVAKQVSGGTLAGVIAGLVALGLFSS